MRGARKWLFGAPEISPRFTRSAPSGASGACRHLLRRIVHGVVVSKTPELLDRRRAAEQEALYLVAGFVAQELQLGVGLDALGQHRQTEAAAQSEHRADDGGCLAVGVYGLDEGAVDLDLVEREGTQVRQRGITGAEIVHRDADAERLDLAQGGQRPI